MIVAVGTIAALQDIPQHAGLAVASFALLTLASIFATTIFWKRDDALAIAVVLVVAVLARSLLLWKTPFLSTDLYRYLWDGRLMVHGIDPYVVTPADPTLHYFRLGWLYQHLDWRSMPSLYPPLGLAFFALAAKMSHANLFGTKLLMEAGDLVTLWLLVVLLRQRRLPRGRAVLYAWCPLVIVEFAWSGHLEAWCLAALAVAVLMQERRQLFASATGIAAAILIKLYPIALIPVFFPRRPWTPVACIGAIVACAYAPFLAWHADVLGFLPQFATQYHFNESLRALLPAPLTAGLFLAAVAAVAWARRAGLGLAEGLIVLIAAYFALSPTVNPWYLTVFALLLPLVVNPFEGALAPLLQGIQLWMLLAVLGYAAEAVPAARIVEYAPLAIGAVWSGARFVAARTGAMHAWLRSTQT